jgi:formylglycine-generating enzyme
MKATQLTLLSVSLLAASFASAAVTINTVFVGNAGNAAQSAANRNHSQSGGDGFGTVDYSYYIGKTTVTNTQYTTFLNAVASSDPHGLWNSNMGSSVHGGIDRSGSDGSYTYNVRTATSGWNSGQSMGNMPVNFVSFWDAARFTNWLTTGDTETGVYVLTASGITNNTITRNEAAWASGGVAIASENEWYKAAYYDPSLNTGSGGYWLYPTQSDTVPTPQPPNSTNANSANYSNTIGTVSEAGAYALAQSAYGTLDQSGNVWEWNDEILLTSNRGLRGASLGDGDALLLSSSFRNSNNSANERTEIGFRVSSLAPIPEPSTYAAILGGLGLLIALLRRKGPRGKC